jgi:hypothetical protein
MFGRGVERLVFTLYPERKSIVKPEFSSSDLMLALAILNGTSGAENPPQPAHGGDAADADSGQEKIRSTAGSGREVPVNR